MEPSDQFAESAADALRALAGPGTGKTYALVRRLVRLLENGANPRRILVVTFARTAANDLVKAVSDVEQAGEELIPRTLHSFCFSLLGREQVLQATHRVPRILLEFERDLLLGDLHGEFGGIRDRRKLVTAFEASWARRQADEPGQPVPGLDQTFQDALLASLRWHRAMLVGEVVPLALSYLSNNPQARERQAYDHVLVDEYQDLNRAEQEVLNLLSADSNIAVIGDDDQSIYRFKWANPEGIREFDREHPGTEDVQFVICRRCPHRVVNMAQTLIERNPGRIRDPLRARDQNPQGEIHHVQWRSVTAEARGIAEFIAHKISGNEVEPGRCLVLANSRQVGYAIRDALRELRVECSSYFREEALRSEAAQEALTLLTLLAYPDDRVALRAWLSFESTTARRPAYRRLLRAAWDRNTSVREVLDLLVGGDLSLPHTTQAVERFRLLLRRLEELSAVSDDLEEVVERLFPEGEEAVEMMRDIALEQLDDVEDLAALANSLRYGVAQRETPLEATEVRVMSMHASKGLTADLVVLAGLVEGIVPRVDADVPPLEQEAQREEQRRLFFVGITRTTRVLVFSTYSQLDAAAAFRLQVARGQRVHGGGFRTFASTFLDELGDGLPEAVRGQDWNYP